MAPSLDNNFKSIEDDYLYEDQQSVKNKCVRSENTSPFERLYTQANMQRLKLEMKRNREAMQTNVNHTFHPNLNKSYNQPSSEINGNELASVIPLPATPTGGQPGMLSLETYKKVYKCNVDNLLKKYALGSQLGYDDTKSKQKKEQLKKENEPPLKPGFQESEAPSVTSKKKLENYLPLSHRSNSQT